MQLMKKTVTFETLDLLKSMREVSQYQIERMKESGYAPVEQAIDSGTTSFGLGRQAGHTEAILEQAKRDVLSGNGVIIVFHNTAYMREFKKSFVDIENVKGKGFAIGISIGGSSSELCGVSRKYGLGKGKTNRLVVDHIMIDGPVTHMPRWRDRFYQNILMHIESNDLKSCVIVGS